MSKADWDREVDVLVCGSGAAGLAAAVVAAAHGLQVLLSEKTSQLGGTTATSGGEMWIPNSRQSRDLKIEDSVENVETYLDALIDRSASRALRAAFVRTAPEAIAYLEANSELRFRSVMPHPDYHQELQGSAIGGRPLATMAFDGRKLGRDFALLRPPNKGFMVLGGMMVTRDDIEPLLKPFASVAAFRRAAGLVGRYLVDRLRYSRGTRLVGGNALVARMVVSLRQRGVDIVTNATVCTLVREKDRIAGAVVRIAGRAVRIRARCGVVLATGGFASNAELRKLYMPGLRVEHSLSFEGDTGDGLSMAVAAGASVADRPKTPAYWMPASVMKWRDGSVSVFPHIRDRARPGIIAVDANGRRFVNESVSYHDFVLAMLEAGVNPAYLVCDRRFIRESGIGLIRPIWQRLRPYLDAGYLHQGATLRELAARIGVDANALERTISEYNSGAANGSDLLFGKGSSIYNRHYGDPSHKPNPCLRPLDAHGPYFAVPVYPVPIGTAVGVRIDENASALDATGQPIAGLYACGNDMASITEGVYPGPGSTIGPGVVFAYRAIRHLASVRQPAAGR